MFDYPVVDVVLVCNLMKTSFQEERSRYEADNRPAHILAGSLHRKWKYVSKAKKNLTFITFGHAKAFHAKGAHKMVNQDKTKNTSPHIRKMRKYALFKFFTVLKLPQKFWNQPEISKIFWKVLAIWKYPDSFWSVRKNLNNPKIYGQYWKCLEK